MKVFALFIYLLNLEYEQQCTAEFHHKVLLLNIERLRDIYSMVVGNNPILSVG